MRQEMEIWCIVNKNEAPRKFTIVKNQLNYISNAQVEAWISENLECVEEWWS